MNLKTASESGSRLVPTGRKALGLPSEELSTLRAPALRGISDSVPGSRDVIGFIGFHGRFNGEDNPCLFRLALEPIFQHHSNI